MGTVIKTPQNTPMNTDAAIPNLPHMPNLPNLPNNTNLAQAPVRTPERVPERVPERINNAAATPAHIFDAIESIYVANQQLEMALRKEQTRARGLENELNQERTQNHALMTEANQKIRDFAAWMEKLKSEVVLRQTREEKLQEHVKSLSGTASEMQSELTNTRNVLFRERKKNETEVETLKAGMEQEQRRVRELEEELRRLHMTHEGLQNELKRDIHGLQMREQKLKAELEQQTTRREKNHERLEQVSSELSAVKSEADKMRQRLEAAAGDLTRYKAAWNEMLQHERKLKQVITDDRAKMGKIGEDLIRTQEDNTRSKLEAQKARAETREIQDAMQARVAEAERRCGDLYDRLSTLQTSSEEIRSNSVKIKNKNEMMENAADHTMKNLEAPRPAPKLPPASELRRARIALEKVPFDQLEQQKGSEMIEHINFAFDEEGALRRVTPAQNDAGKEIPEFPQF
ncbi:hypothetical protein WDW86_02590 [Bdellovibrionota bacterium FG-2]